MPNGTFPYPTRRPNRLAAESTWGRIVWRPNRPAAEPSVNPLKHDVKTGHQIVKVRITRVFEDKSILTFLQYQSITRPKCRGIRDRTKYISFVHVFVLMILGNFGHFAFWPISRLSIVPSLCGHFQTG